MLKLVADDLLRLRKQYLYLLTWTLIVLSVFAILIIIVNANSTGTISPVGITVIPIALLSSSVWLWALRRDRVGVAAFGLMGTLLISFFAAPEISGIVPGTLTLFTAALFLRRSYYYAAVAVIFLRLAFALSTEFGAPVVDYTVVVNLLLQAMTFTGAAVITRALVISTLRALERTTRLTYTLQTASDVEQIIMAQSEPLEMMRMTINAIRDRLGFYHAQVFLLNETGDQAVLRASTGDIGYQLLARRHQITVGSQSVVGQAVLRGAPVLVADTAEEATFFRNELLPNTRAEYTIPLKESNRVFGALDVQSTVAEGFTPADRQSLNAIGDALALALRDTRLVAEQSKIAEENARLLQQLEGLQRENDRLNRELTQATWSEYLSQRSTMSGIDLQGDQITPAETWTPDLERARAAGEPVMQPNVVAVPVMLRGEVIGAIEVDPGQSTPAETAEVALAVAQRLAVSLESARLYEETRQSAFQEQQINEIAARFGTTGSIDELLRITLVELADTLGARGGSIRLGSVKDGGSET